MAPHAPAAPIDILDDLLSAPPSGPIPEQLALARVIRRAVSTAPAPAQRPRPVRTIASPAVTHDRIKTTQYFDPETYARLDKVKARLATSGRRKDFGRISKSRIVEAALRHALEDFESLGGDSRLCRDLENTKGA